MVTFADLRSRDTQRLIVSLLLSLSLVFGLLWGRLARQNEELQHRLGIIDGRLAQMRRLPTQNLVDFYTRAEVLTRGEILSLSLNQATISNVRVLKTSFSRNGRFQATLSGQYADVKTYLAGVSERASGYIYDSIVLTPTDSGISADVVLSPIR